MSHSSKTQLIITVIVIILTCHSQLSWAGEKNQPKPLALRTIMQGMSNDMQAITDAISREQWDKVAKISPLIGNHAQPSFTEKMRILRFIGSDSKTYRRYDKITQQAAQILSKTATTENGELVISSFAELQNSCLNCHQRFRQPFVEHFYD